MRELLRTLGKAPAAKAETEASLISAAQGGDSRAFDQLVRDQGDALRRFIGRRVPSAQVDDLVQDTWVAAWGSLAKFTIRARFKTWLFAIAANKCRDWHRKTSETELIDEDGADEPAYALFELRSTVGHALDALGPVHRELLDLYYFDQLTLREIATITGRNLNTVKYQFYRAHKEIAEQLEGYHG